VTAATPDPAVSTPTDPTPTASEPTPGRAASLRDRRGPVPLGRRLADRDIGRVGCPDPAASTGSSCSTSPRVRRTSAR
jgi:hypothetical protein